MDRLARFLLLCTVALPAQPAQAGPVVAFAQGIAAALGAYGAAGAATATAIGGGAALGASVGGFLFGGSVLGNLVLSLGASVLSKALAPKQQQASQSPAVLQRNYAQDLSEMQFVYGRVKKGGPFSFTAFSNSTRYYGVLIAAHSTRGVVAHYLDDREVAVNAAGMATTAPYAGKHVYIATYNGGANQAVPSVLDYKFAAFTAEDDFRGLSHAVLYARRVANDLISEVYPNSREPEYAPIWDGHDRVYDPRTDSYGWTQNAALIIAAEARRFGKSVHWPSVAAEADICDQIVENGDGGTQPRWTINGVFGGTEKWETVRARLEMACDAFFFERTDGLLGFYVGQYIAPSVTLIDGDFLSLVAASGDQGPDVTGSVAVSYVEPIYSYAEQLSAAYVVADDGARATPEAYLIDSHNQALRVAKRAALRARPDFSVSGTIGFIGYELIGQRFARIQHAEAGWDMVIEITKLVRRDDRISFDFEGVSVRAEDFDFDAVAEEPARPLRAVVDSDDAVAVPTGLSGTARSGSVIVWSWPDQGDSSLRQELRWREAGATDWQHVYAAVGQTSVFVGGLADGVTYEANLRSRSSGGPISGWSDVVLCAAVANSVAPAPVSGFAAVLDGAPVISWTAPNDPNFWAARIYRSTDSASFSAAQLVRTEYGGIGGADSWVDAAAQAGVHRYWIAAINASGKGSAAVGPLIVEIN